MSINNSVNTEAAPATIITPEGITGFLFDYTSGDGECWSAVVNYKAEKPQFAEIYLGNPGDVSYQDKPVRALYLGSMENCMGGHRHYWLNRDHDGTRPMVSVTSNRQDRSTYAQIIFKGDHWTTLEISPELASRAMAHLDWSQA